MDFEHLLVTRHDAVACVSLNRPSAMNALSMALRHSIVAAVDALSRDPSVRVLVLTGTGRAFCAGLDLRELPGLRVAENLFEADPIAAIGRFPGPVIGAINGVAVTGGLELALACDVLLASSEARFADTHARVGVIPGWGLSQKLPRLIGISRAKEMAFSGNFVSAEQAERWGLVNRVVEPDALMPQAMALAADMASSVEGMLPVYKRLIDDGYATSFGDGMKLEAQATKRWASGLTPEQLAARGAGAVSRGRGQR